MITGSATAEREALSQKRQELMRRKIAVARHVPYHPGCADLEVWLAKEINSLDAVLAADTAEGVPMTDAELAEIESSVAHGRCNLCGGFIGPDHTGRPMCYRCAPKEAIPDCDWAKALVAEVRRLRALSAKVP